jgi:DNA-binding Lrp family transcriptional regulator
MKVEEAILRVQSAYPRIYLACHSRHQNRRTTAKQISQRDATLLAHLSETAPTSQRDLAAHMGIGKSTVSAAVTSLENMGFVARAGAVLRTEAGTQAMRGSSVLEAPTLKALLLTLDVNERIRAVEGLELLAAGARRLRVSKKEKRT